MSMMESDDQDQGGMPSGDSSGGGGADNLGQNPMIAATAMICITAIIVAVIIGILL